MKTRIRCTLVAVLLLFVSSAVFPQLTGSRGGKLDREYADNGIGVYPQSEFYGDSLALDDGSVLQLSTAKSYFPSYRFSVELRKFTSAGAPDPDFGTNGWKVYDFGYDTGGVAIARLNDGKYLIGGSAQPSGQYGELDFLIFRIYSNGDIDTTFGNTGFVLKNFPGPTQTESTMDGADAIYPMSDGKILVVGTSTIYSQMQRGAVFAKAVRLNADGSVDSSYGMDGSASVVVGTNGLYITTGARNSSSLLDSTGRLIVGTATDLPLTGGGYSSTCKLVRFASDGVVDPKFGQNGVKELTPGQSSGCAAISRFPDGRIAALTGYSLKALNDNGSENETFANNGTLLLGDRLLDLLITENGKIYVAGYREGWNSSYTQHAIIKAYHQNGSPDLHFGTLGIASLRMSDQTYSGFRRIHLLQSGSLLALGFRGLPPYLLLVSRFSFVRP